MEAFREVKSMGVSWNPEENKTGWKSILNYDNYNGRINMAEKIAIRNKATEYRGALTGLQEDSLLSSAYFSEENIQILQNGLRAGVYEVSKKEIVIPPQNIDNLKIIMRSIYLQYANHTKNVKDITEEIQKLNKYVLEYCVKSVYNSAQGYINYCKDQSTLVMPMDRPTQVDRDHKHLEWKQWI